MSKKKETTNTRIQFDQELASNKTWLIGIDEVGYGCFSGSLVVGAVAINFQKLEGSFPNLIELFKLYPQFLKVRDSKKTTEANRALVQSELFKFANEHSILFYSYGEATVEEINTLGMTKSHNLATERALNGLKAQRLKDPDLKPDYRIIIDGNKIDECLKTEPTTCIIQADDKSFTVASASILAKQFRDEQIKKLSQEFPQYHWDKNKGYGTADHRAALKKHGLTPHHRLKYCRNHL